MTALDALSTELREALIGGFAAALVEARAEGARAAEAEADRLRADVLALAEELDGEAERLAAIPGSPSDHPRYAADRLRAIAEGSE